MCADQSVIGAPFYVMEYVEGRVLRTLEDGADVAPQQAGELSERLAEALAAIHRVDVEKAGLADFGRPDGYMARQLKRWGQQWERSQTRPLPEYDRLVERLGALMPVDAPPRLGHGPIRPGHALARLQT